MGSEQSSVTRRKKKDAGVLSGVRGGEKPLGLEPAPQPGAAHSALAPGFPVPRLHHKREGTEPGWAGGWAELTGVMEASCSAAEGPGLRGRCS